MKEASRVKFYFAKYFFLAFGVLQWICGMLLFLGGDADKNKRVALLFFLIGLAFVALYFFIASRLKRVAIGKKRLMVIDDDKTEHFEWSEVKYVKVVPYFNLYVLKLRGRKERIYFLPQENSEPLFGLFVQQPELAEALRKKR
ncbi:MAG TPA: hypothetical protein VG737_17835 [Cyclobacteriaceae bacterium]|nr:hypothetical protein [Cyclobacteriaceae bacterium]